MGEVIKQRCMSKDKILVKVCVRERERERERDEYLLRGSARA